MVDQLARTIHCFPWNLITVLIEDIVTNVAVFTARNEQTSFLVVDAEELKFPTRVNLRQRTATISW